MYTLIIVLVILAAILMCGIVLIQESKGGGLASGFSSSNQIMGVRKTTDFLEKATWGLAIAIVVLSVLSAAFVTREVVEETPLTPATTQTNANNLQTFPAQQSAGKADKAAEAEAPAQETPANAGE